MVKQTMKTFDLHIGLSDSVLELKKDPLQKHGLGNNIFPDQFDVYRAQAGELDTFLGMMCPIVFTNSEAALPKDSFAEIQKHIFVYINLEKKGAFRLVKNKKDLASKSLKVVLGIEGLYGLADEQMLPQIENLFQQGVQVIGPIWNFSTNLFQRSALTPLDNSFLNLCEKYNIILDLAHSEQSIFENILEHYNGPLIDTHTNYGEVFAHRRNITKEQMQTLKGKGGIVGISFVGEFVGNPSMQRVYEHIDQILQDFGDDFIAIGSDFDGMDFTDMAPALEDVSCYPHLQEFLLSKGIEKETVEKIFYTNAFTYFSSVYDKKNDMKEEKIIQNLVDVVIQPKKNEKVLLITSERENPFFVAQLFYEAFTKTTKEVTLLVQPPRLFEEPMNTLTYLAIQAAPDIVLELDVDTLGHDFVGITHPHTKSDISSNNILYFLKNTKKIRAFWFAVNTLDHFMDSLAIDLISLKKRTERVQQVLPFAAKAIIQTGANARLSIDLYADPEKIGVSSYTGTEYLPGSGGNLPLGEIYVTPKAGYAYGTIIIDSCYYNEVLEKTIFLSAPLTLIFDGYLKEIQGGTDEAQAFTTFLEQCEERTKKLYTTKRLSSDLYRIYKKNIRNIGELGVGLNPACRFADDLLFAEKVLGSCHIALGRSYHGNMAIMHSDMVITKPTLSLLLPDKEVTIIQSGVFVE